MWETQVWSLDWEDPPEKGMATHSSILAWRIPWTEEPGGLRSMGSQRVGHDWETNTYGNLKNLKEECWSFLILPYLPTSHPIRSTSTQGYRLFLNIICPGNTMRYLLAHLLSIRTIPVPCLSITFCSLVVVQWMYYAGHHLLSHQLSIFYTVGFFGSNMDQKWLLTSRRA